MTATLRVVLDQVVAPTDDDLAWASRDLAVELVAGAPSGCEVAAIVPTVRAGHDGDPRHVVAGLAEVHRTRLARRELAAAWQLGAKPGVGGGMIHSPSLLAPLAAHDRVHDHDQTVVTLWDLRAWDAPDELPRGSVAWQRAMLKRAVRHADAVVVPTHAMARRLGELARLGDRIRVVAGAPPTGFARPVDEVGRVRALSLPPDLVVVVGGAGTSARLGDGLAAAAGAIAARPELSVVVVDAPEGGEPAVADLAAAEGIPERRVHVRGALDARDRAAVLGSAAALIAPARRGAFPWRVLEALAVGTPVVAAASPVHAEVVVDGGLVVGAGGAGADADAGGPDASALAEAAASVVSDSALATRLRVLAADRGRAFSWREAAERVWQLHAEL